jgi:DNA replication and repair protein RecF
LLISHISLRNFKNYEDFSFSFAPAGNLIVGDNGIGKTNLLEAISYFTYGRSILHSSDAQLITFSSDEFRIKSTFMVKDAPLQLKAYFSKDKKVIQIDDKPLKKMTSLYDLLQMVYSGPDDIYQIFSTPAKRRQFLDMAISKVFPAYMDHLRSFHHALIQRNALLKTEFTPSEKDAWDDTFVRAAKEVVDYRMRFFSLLADQISYAYQNIISQDEHISIDLKLNFFHATDFHEKMLWALSDIVIKEKRYQQSQIGPHRDDFVISIDTKNAFHFASQGQKRSIVIALKLALANIIKSINEINPILIFDDTLAELDIHRSARLLDHLTKHHQVFIASPNLDKYMSVDLPVIALSQHINKSDSLLQSLKVKGMS